MVVIKTFEGDILDYELNSCFIQGEDKFNGDTKHYIKFKENKVELPYYESESRCGIQYLGYKEFISLYPYRQFYDRIKPITLEEYNSVLKKINSRK